MADLAILLKDQQNVLVEGGCDGDGALPESSGAAKYTGQQGPLCHDYAIVNGIQRASASVYII